MGNWQGTQNPRVQYDSGPLLSPSNRRGNNVEAKAFDRQAILEERRKERIKNALMTQLGPHVHTHSFNHNINVVSKCD